VTGKFCTVVDPKRDVGPVRIHGLRASDVAGAPVFADIAAAAWGLLAGRVLVAHNVSFDAGAARYNPAIGDDERDNFHNVLLLCLSHHGE
jgi:DNA polymerase III epsilon subunit-like protein